MTQKKNIKSEKILDYKSHTKKCGFWFNLNFTNQANLSKIQYF